MDRQRQQHNRDQGRLRPAEYGRDLPGRTWKMFTGHLSRRGPTAIDADNPADRGWGQSGAVLRAATATTATVVVTAEYAKHLGAAALTISARFEFG